MDIAIGNKTDFPESIYVIKENDKKIVEAKGDYRRIMERKPIDMIYNFEYDTHRDFIYYRNSGFNHVLANIAKKRDIVVGFSFNKFKEAKNKYQILGRLHQNFRLARKYKVKTHVVSFAKKQSELQNEITLKAFERLLIKKKLY